MKYSIIFPYYMRESMRNTFMTFRYRYATRNDFEIIIIEDYKNIASAEEHEKLMAILSEFTDLNIKYLKQDFYQIMDPGPAYNYGVKNSTGEYILLSNPEIVHDSDVLAGLDTEFTTPGAYVLCSCMNVRNFKDIASAESISGGLVYEKIEWYQHSIHWNRRLNFCSGISRADYDRIGGFDEDYRFGYTCTDVDFLRRVVTGGLRITLRDDLVTLHQNHPRVYGITAEELAEKFRINQKVLKEKWG